MNKKTRVVTLSALFAALSVISLYIASVWPTGLFGLTAFSSLFTAAAVVDAGVAPGMYVYVVTSALGMLLLPDKSAPVLYMLFFGYYPVVKSLIERIGSKARQWFLKLLVFNAALTVLWFFLRALIFGSGLTGRFGGPAATLIVYIGGSAVFALFDYGFTKAIWLYIGRVSGKK